MFLKKISKKIFVLLKKGQKSSIFHLKLYVFVIQQLLYVSSINKLIKKERALHATVFIVTQEN